MNRIYDPYQLYICLTNALTFYNCKKKVANLGLLEFQIVAVSKYSIQIARIFLTYITKIFSRKNTFLILLTHNYIINIDYSLLQDYFVFLPGYKLWKKAFMQNINVSNDTAWVFKSVWGCNIFVDWLLRKYMVGYVLVCAKKKTSKCTL